MYERILNIKTEEWSVSERLRLNPRERGNQRKNPANLLQEISLAKLWEVTTINIKIFLRKSPKAC